MEVVEKALDLPVNQILALFNKVRFVIERIAMHNTEIIHIIWTKNTLCLIIHHMMFNQQF